jgi:DNA topoisomerase-1
LADRETILPSVQEGEELRCQLMEPKSHTTQPPSRYNEATLTRALEDLGIGRPSTYAAIIETIQARDYVFKKSNALVPTWVGFAVAQLLERHLPTLVDYQFTAQMEEDLDAISRGEAGHLDYLKQFYFGNGRPGLRQQLANKIEEIDPREVSRISLGRPDRPGAEGEEIFVRIGRYGPFLEQGERRSPIPDGQAPDELTITAALEMLAQAGLAQEPLGHCPETGKPVYLKNGRFGPYVQRGNADDEEKPKNASLLKGMKPEDVDLETALKLLSLPRTLGVNPQNDEPIISQNGRFGPYIKCGSDTRSLPAGVSPIEVTLNEALELLAQPKAARRGFGAPREPLRTLEASPITGEPIKLLEGRYGFYVTDGVTNASLPKDSKPDELTLPQALELLAARAAAGPPAKKKRGFKRGAPKSAAPKKAAKTTKKKTPARKAASSTK